MTRLNFHNFQQPSIKHLPESVVYSEI